MTDMSRARFGFLFLSIVGALAMFNTGCGDDDKASDAGRSGTGGDSQSGGKGGSTAPGAGTGGSKAGSGGSTAAGSGGKGGSGASGAGGAGTGASGAGAGGAGTGGAGSGAPGSASVLERNKNPSRDGLFIQPGLTKAMVAKMALDADFKAMFTGNMWASPLYLENGPNNKGLFFAVTTGNAVYALDEATGATVWMKSIGSSPAESGAGCGSIKPVGIISTPVIDGTAKTIYVAGAIGTSGIMRHELHALATDDGTPRAGWPVDVTKIKAGSLAFMPAPHNQRSALSLVNGIVYVAYGGHVGDCGAYHGWVIGVDGKDPTKTGAWATRGQGEGIWAAGGMASDGKDVFAITGNRTGSGQTDQRMTDSEQVVRISGLGQFTLDNKNLFFPTSWRAMDSTDADFGASSPVFITLAGSTPSNIVVAIAKDGHFYLLDAANLGGSNGSKPIVDFMVSTGNMSLRTVPAAYPGSNGVNIVFTADSGGQCPAGGGGGGGKKVMAVQVQPGSPPTTKVLWCAAQGGESTAPIVTTTDGKSEPIVWFSNNGKLNAVDGETGAVLWNGGNDTCSGVRRWTSPIAVKGRIVVGGDDHLCSWSVH
jgi:hypothetical protein